MDEPSWNIGFPCTPSLFQDRDTQFENNLCGMLDNITSPSDKSPGSSIVTPDAHLGNKQNVALANSSPRSGGIDVSSASEAKIGKKVDYPKVFLPKRQCVLTDLHELECSVDATIAKHRETYICMHDVAEYVSKKVAAQRLGIKWRHYDDRHFLFNLEDKITRDRFLASSQNVPLGDGLVKFAAWKKDVAAVTRPCIIKVWLRLTGLPVEYYDFSSVEFIVSSFGRLYKCNLEKKNLYLGCFYVMIDCPNVEAIAPIVYVQTSDDGEFPVSVAKQYACPIDVYNNQNFGDSTTYDEIISTLVNRGKLIPL